MISENHIAATGISIKYEPAQIDSVIQLVNDLIQRFNIERKIPNNYMDYYGIKLKDFNGVIGHVNVRDDKTDPLPDDNYWKAVINGCNLQIVDIGGTAPQAPHLSGHLRLLN